MPFNNENLAFPTFGGRNLAPLKPLLALKESNGDKSPGAQHYLAQALKEKYDSLMKQNEKAWKEMYAVGQMIELFIEGKQILDFNPYTNVYTPRKLKNTDPNKIKAVNFMQYYCSNWEAKWGASNPDIVIKPLSNADQDIARARKANIVVDGLETKWYSAWYNQIEARSAQVFGTYINRVREDFGDKKRFAIRQIMEDRPVQFGDGFGKCHDCGFAGKATQFPADSGMPTCPECSSPGVVVDSPVSELIPQIVGQEKIYLPNIVLDQIPFSACRWDLRRRAEKSSWFIYEQDLSEGLLKRFFGNIKLPEGESINRFGLDTIARLAATGSPVSGKSAVGFNEKEQKEHRFTLTEMYLSAEDIADIVVKGEAEGAGEMTVENQRLPIGARLSDIFPDGCCALGVNGMSLIVGLYGEHHSTSVTSGVYHVKLFSGTGRGVSDAVEIQKRFNRQDSQISRFWAGRATPATLHVEGAIAPDKRKLLGQPDVDIPVKIQNFPEFRSLDQLVKPMQSESIGGDFLNYTYTHLQSFMQLAYHITDFSGGLGQRVNNKTATGAEILDANADALFSPCLSMKAEVRLETAQKGFAKWCKANPIPTFLPFKQPVGGKTGAEIAGKDVGGDYEWSVADGSEEPKNRRTKKQNAVTFYQQFGGIMGYIQAKQIAPQEVTDAERLFDMDFAAEQVDSVAEVCRMRLEQGKQLLGQASQLRQQAQAAYNVDPASLPPVDYMSILMQVEPSMLVTEPHQQEKVKWFSDLLDTDEGMEMSREERELVSAFIQGQMQLAQGQALGIMQKQTELQQAAAQPQMEAQAAQAEMQNQQGAQQADAEQQRMQQEAAENESQRAHEREGRAGEAAEAEAQRAHEAAQADADRQHQLELAKYAQSNQNPAK